MESQNLKTNTENSASLCIRHKSLKGKDGLLAHIEDKMVS